MSAEKVAPMITPIPMPVLEKLDAQAWKVIAGGYTCAVYDANGFDRSERLTFFNPDGFTRFHCNGPVDRKRLSTGPCTHVAD